ncbi:MAG: flagellar biosynthesis protein FlgB [Acidobacteria bacterium]|nr:flagellar biosynthesis protein FlgB [Acidobacteriota bacterium]
MNLLSARQRVVASNIANADTPNYRTQDVDFRAEFESAVGGKPKTVEVAGLEVKSDGNNVSLDREARQLAENAIRFNIASQLSRSQIRLLRSAIQEGKNT